MAVFDIAQWCAEMLVDTGSATEQPGAASSSMASTPAPALPPVARVPMSDGLEAVVVLDDSTDPCPAVNAASQQRVDTVSVDPSLLQGPFVSEPVAHPGFVAWQADPVYRAWLPHIETPIAPLKQLCGQQVRPLVGATLFGGALIGAENLPTAWAAYGVVLHMRQEAQLRCLVGEELQEGQCPLHGRSRFSAVGLRSRPVPRWGDEGFERL